MTVYKIGLDFDGTLNNSLPRHAEVLSSVLRELNLSLSGEILDAYLEHKRDGMSTLEYLRHYNVPNADFISRRWREKIEDNDFIALDSLYEGTLVLLERLSKIADLYVVTARKREEAVLDQIQSMGVSQYIQTVSIVPPGSKASRQKAKATQKLGLTHIIGDSEVDLEWAEALHVDFFPLCCGARSDSWWQRNGWDSFPILGDVVDQIYSRLPL